MHIIRSLRRGVVEWTVALGCVRNPWGLRGRNALRAAATAAIVYANAQKENRNYNAEDNTNHP